MRDAVVAPIQTLPEHLRQSSGTDLSVHTREHLDKVAIELNGRPRKTVRLRHPANQLTTLLAAS